MNDSITLIRQREVSRMTGLSRTSIWRWEKDGRFPPRRRLGARCVCWLRHEVEAWILEQTGRPGEERDDEAGEDA